MTSFDFFANCTTIEDARKRYHQLAAVYHSDKDNGDAETMKLLNDQFAAWIGKDEAARADVPELPAGVLALPEHLPDAPSAEAVAAAEFMQVIGVLVKLPGISCELCGSWVWISGDTKSVKDQLKDAGCKFASKKSMWYWAPAGSRGRRGRGSLFSSSPGRQVADCRSCSPTARAAISSAVPLATIMASIVSPPPFSSHLARCYALLWPRPNSASIVHPSVAASSGSFAALGILAPRSH